MYNTVNIHKEHCEHRTKHESKITKSNHVFKYLVKHSIVTIRPLVITHLKIKNTHTICIRVFLIHKCQYSAHLCQ